MAAKRLSYRREQDLERLSQLYLTGRTQAQIAKILEVHQGTVSRDLRALQARWLESSRLNLDMRKAKELAKIDALELVYWRAWRRSRQDAETNSAEKTTGGDGEKTKTSKRRVGQAGDPAFLAGVQWCIERRCRILGLDAPKKPDVNAAVAANVGTLNLTLLSNDQLTGLRAALIAARGGVGQPPDSGRGGGMPSAPGDVPPG